MMHTGARPVKALCPDRDKQSPARGRTSALPSPQQARGYAMRRHIITIAVIGLLAVGCFNGSDKPDPKPTVGTSAETTSAPSVR
ncbi:hypothetical protein GCM10015536_74130 [Streptomyces griseomycini]|nr:hypothetical protein GCM10015536_74130 [Streptomyces griseomycini]